MCGQTQVIEKPKSRCPSANADASFTTEPTMQAAEHNVEPRDRPVGSKAMSAEFGFQIGEERVELGGSEYRSAPISALDALVHNEAVAIARLGPDGEVYDQWVGYYNADGEFDAERDPLVRIA